MSLWNVFVKRIFSISLTAALLLGVFSNMSDAALIKYDFDCIVEYARYSPVQIGSTISGSFFYDPENYTSNVYDWYHWHDSPRSAGISVTFGDNTVSTDGVIATQIFDGTQYGLGYDSFTMNASSTDRPVEMTDWSPVRMNIGFRDETGTVFQDDTLPNTLNLLDFSSGIFQYRDTTWKSYDAGFGLGLEFSGKITGLSMNAAPVPEPATIILLGTGLLGMAGVSRRKFRRK